MDIDKEKELLAENPFHIYLMVKAAKRALDEGRAVIQDGVLVFQPPQNPAVAESATQNPQQLPEGIQKPPEKP